MGIVGYVLKRAFALMQEDPSLSMQRAIALAVQRGWPEVYEELAGTEVDCSYNPFLILDYLTAVHNLHNKDFQHG